MLHVYAYVDAPAQLPTVAGLGGAPLRAVTAAGIDAILSEDGGDAGDDAVLAHARIVEEAAVVNASVLPARFPGRYANEAALVAAIEERATVLREALDRVHGCVEVGVRVVRQTAGGDGQAISGGDYMRARLDAVRDAERVAGELDDAVGTVARAATRSVVASADLVVSTAYLLSAEQADAFASAVETVAGRHGDLAFVPVGPWPPYSFALVDGREP